MINVEMSDLPVEKINKIRAWLDKEECGWLENCVASQIAALQSEATNGLLRNPEETLKFNVESPLPQGALAPITEAAVLQSFLDVIKEMRQKETRFQTARLTI